MTIQVYITNLGDRPIKVTNYQGVEIVHPSLDTYKYCYKDNDIKIEEVDEE